MADDNSIVQDRSQAAGSFVWLRALPSPRESLWVGVLLALAAALPALLSTYPAMVDYPAHLARYHVMLDAGRSPFLTRYYGFEWMWVGNLGADILIRPLAALFGLERAGWLVVAALPALTGLAIVTVEWTLRRRVGVGSLLALAFIWSPALLLGFLNFGISLIMALFAFALWVRLDGWRWRWALFVPIGLAVWLAHVSGWGVLGLMVFGYEWHRTHRDGARPIGAYRLPAFLAPLPLITPLLIMLTRAVSGAAGSGGAGSGGGELFGFGPDPLRYKRLIWQQAMRDGGMAMDYWSLALVVAALLLALALRRIDARLGWGALLLMLASLAMPRHIFGGDYVDYRMISTGLMVACLAICWKAPRWALMLAPLLFLVRLDHTTAEWRQASRDTARQLTALDHVPTGARVASATGIGMTGWSYNAYEHICGYAVVRRDALTNCNFALPGVHMLTLREGGGGFRDPSHRVPVWPGKPIDLRDFSPATQADYLWYVGPDAPILLPRGATVIYRARHTILARLANRPGHS